MRRIFLDCIAIETPGVSSLSDAESFWAVAAHKSNKDMGKDCEYAFSELSPEQREAVEAIRKESESKDTKAVLI